MQCSFVVCYVVMCMVRTVDNNITLTFRFVSVPFFWNDSTVLRSVFRPFYGPSFDRSAVRLSCVLWKRTKTVVRRTGASERNDLRDYRTIIRCRTSSAVEEGH